MFAGASPVVSGLAPIFPSGAFSRSESYCSDSAIPSMTLFHLTHRPQSTQPAAVRLNRAIEG
jgi:hypothetical protein